MWMQLNTPDLQDGPAPSLLVHIKLGMRLQGFLAHRTERSINNTSPDILNMTKLDFKPRNQTDMDVKVPITSIVCVVFDGETEYISI